MALDGTPGGCAIPDSLFYQMFTTIGLATGATFSHLGSRSRRISPFVSRLSDRMRGLQTTQNDPAASTVFAVGRNGIPPYAPSPAEGLTSKITQARGDSRR